jgi:hypothetical protein
MATQKKKVRLAVRRINAFAKSRSGRLAISQAVQRATASADKLRIQSQIDPKKLDLPITL